MYKYYFIIIVLIVVSILFICKETFKSHTSKSLPKESFLNKDMIEDTKYMFRKLAANKHIIKIKGPIIEQETIPGTTDELLIRNLNNITKRILKPFCKELIKTSYDRIKLYTSPDLKQKNYKYECFVYNMIGSLLVKIYIDVYVKVRPQKRKFNNPTCTEITNKPFKSYAIGIPCKDQLIPLPTDVITTSRTVLSWDSIETENEDKILFLNINKIHILNSTLIPNSMDGNWSDTLPLTDLYSKAIEPNTEKAVQYNKWPDLPGLSGKQAYFSVQHPFEWDNLGLENNSEQMKIKDNNTCALTYATNPPDRVPNFWPFNIRGPKFGGKYQWLFSLGRGMPQFPHGNSN